VTRLSAGAKRPLEADDLFKFEVLGDPQASPDGQRVAWVQTRPVKDEDTYKGSRPTHLRRTSRSHATVVSRRDVDRVHLQSTTPTAGS
jgi:dipeptidyl aminopeptidase/acylaminoacyl peptidase